MHRRLGRLVLPVLLLTPFAPLGAAGADDARALLAKHRAFVGWQLGDGTFKTIRLAREYTNGEGEVVQHATEVRAGLVYRTTVVYPKRAGTSDEAGFTGNVFWTTNINGFTTPIYGDLAKYLLSYELLMDEGTTALQGTLTGTGSADGKAAQTIRLEVPNGDPIDVYVDPASGAYLKAVVDPDGDYETTVQVLSYTDVTPGKKMVGSYRVGTGSSGAYTYTKIEPNVPITDDALHPPTPRATWSFANPQPFPISVTPTRLLVDASVNGVKGRFILDTGASQIFLDERFADRAKVAKLDVHGAALGLLGTQRTTMRKADSVTIGGNTLSNVIVEAQDFTSADYRGLDQKNYDGLLGYDVFAGAVVRLDFRAGSMTISDPAAQQGDPPGIAILADISDWTPAIPMTLDRTIPVKAMLDTGDPQAIVFGPDLLYKYHLRMARNIGFQAGVGSIECGNIDTLQIGPITYSGEMACKLDSVLVSGRRIVVGLDFLRNFIVTFDYPHGRLFLQPPPR
ncbi:MAG: retropepsin-like aspartic protease [Candidatus Baltobacteraceae bacterium]